MRRGPFGSGPGRHWTGQATRGNAVTPAASLVLCVARAATIGDWALARWAAREAVASRAVVLWDDGAEVERANIQVATCDPIQRRRGLDVDERPRRMVGAERNAP